MIAEKDTLLAPYRVLDLTNEWGFLCGKLLGDLGADILKVEKPGGDPARNIGPFFQDAPDPQKSLYWFFYNSNKRGITLDIEKADGQALFKRLVKKADFVVESFHPGYLDSLGLSYSTLSELNPRLILTSITPFGQSGPYSRYRGSDIVTSALSGWLYKCGDDDRAPLQIGVPQAYYHAAAQAAGATLIAHYYRENTGEGQQVDVSPLPWTAYFSQAPIRWWVTRHNESRHGPLWEWSGRPLVRYVWPCKDGAVCFAVTGGARFGQSQKAIIEWMDSLGVAPDYLKTIDWDAVDWGHVTQELRDSFEQPVADFLKNQTKAAIFAESLKRGIVLFPANTAQEILADPQLKFRQYWLEVEHPELGITLTYPGPFFKSSQTAWQLRYRAPLIGEHNADIYLKELGLSTADLVLLKEHNVI